MKTNRFIFFIFFTFIFCRLSAPGMVAAQNPDATPTAEPSSAGLREDIIKNLEKRYNTADFSARFSQESALKALDIKDTASGKVWFKHPGMMQWEYEQPEKYAIISDGKTLWIFRPEDNQVVIGDAMTYFGNGKGASFLSNFNLVQDTYTVSVAAPANPDQYTLKLVPRQKQLDLSAIFLNIDKASFEIKSVVTLNEYGDETRIEFRDLVFEPLDASLFNFQIPAGAEVLKMDE
ncbi:MAG: outer membrane lipoprotein chaperone LolA [Desulfosalsimonadaceae bacterium]|nr:outer membrane lipoprotein chaperone LolA [Desulfosalsimonadaceae bacterium]